MNVVDAQWHLACTLLLLVDSLPLPLQVFYACSCGHFSKNACATRSTQLCVRNLSPPYHPKISGLVLRRTKHVYWVGIQCWHECIHVSFVSHCTQNLARAVFCRKPLCMRGYKFVFCLLALDLVLCLELLFLWWLEMFSPCRS